MTTIIGHKIVVQIGGTTPIDPVNPGEIVGSLSHTFVPDNEVHKYDKIVGESISLNIGGNEEKIRELLEDMKNKLEVIEGENEGLIDRINEIQKEKDKETFYSKLNSLLEIGGNVSQISSLVLQIIQLTK